MAPGDTVAIVTAFSTHLKHSRMQSKGPLALRNLVSRNPELIAPLLADYTGRLILLLGVNGVFFCSAGLGCLMILHALYVRRGFVEQTIDRSMKYTDAREQANQRKAARGANVRPNARRSGN